MGQDAARGLFLPALLHAAFSLAWDAVAAGFVQPGIDESSGLAAARFPQDAVACQWDFPLVNL
jgi:hypothetical protein